MKKAKGFIRSIQAFMDSARGKTILNYLYSWGAAIVILGTLFKLTHMAGANIMLFVGMGTEVIVFFFSAFERPYEVAEDEKREEAEENVAASPWSDRIVVVNKSLQEFNSSEGFDAIVSNPPYFVDSLLSPDEKRTTARHTNTLSFSDLFDGVERLLAQDGTFALILPPAEAERFLSVARGRLFLKRRCDVWSTPESGIKRVMMELQKQPSEELPTIEKLIIEDSGPMGYSAEYRELTRDFYLKF